MTGKHVFFRPFMLTLCMVLLIALTGMAFAIADINTRRTVSSAPITLSLNWEAGIGKRAEWLRQAIGFLPAPLRLLWGIPEGIGLAIPQEQKRQEELPRFSQSVETRTRF